MYETRKLNFDLVIQRKDNIWDLPRKSMFIHSILNGFPVPALFATRDEEEAVYHFLDGKQRLTSVFSFLNDDFALHASTPSIDEQAVAGMTFSQLPEELRERIAQYDMDVVKMENVTPQEMEDMFYRLNNGVPLRKIETSRAILGSRVLRFVESIANMDFFAEKINLSKSARLRYVDQELVLQILSMIYHENAGFSSKELQSLVFELRDMEIQAELRSKIQNASYYLNEAFTKKESFLKKLHIPMLFKMVLETQGTGNMVPPKQFHEWAVHFFEKTPKIYFEASQSGSARKENVQKRLQVIREDFLRYSKKFQSGNEPLVDDEETEEKHAVS
jgi:hypothetical protein